MAEVVVSEALAPEPRVGQAPAAIGIQPAGLVEPWLPAHPAGLAAAAQGPSY